MMPMLPAHYKTLMNLYWRLRAARGCSRPCPRTWQRRIRAEKTRLLEAGLTDIFLLHAVCRYLRDPENRHAAVIPP